MKSGFLFALIGALLSSVVVFMVMKDHNLTKNSDIGVEELAIAESSVRARLKHIEEKLVDQLNAFSDAVASDKYFALKLFVENNKSASDVVDIAGRYLRVMNFSVLAIVDSSNSIVSSGHFPASAGSNVLEHIAHLSSKPIAISENIIGNQVLTLQSKREFKIADFKFYAVGGYEVNDDLLAELSPWDKVKIVLKQGSKYTGMSGIHSVSEVKDHKIIINDKEYFASQIPFPSAEDNGETSLIITMEK